MTIFSKIVAGEIPAYKVAENDEFLAFLDIFPLTEGHLLVILHAPPKPEETEREGRFFWRDANGQWTPPGTAPSQPGIGQLLAEYERMSDRVVATEAALRQQLFGPRPAAEVSLAFVADEPVGFAVYFPSFSTFACRPGLYLEDLFIDPKWRGRGFGRQLLAHIAKMAVERGCDRMNWVVLPWNQPAIDFYRRLGAEKITEWESYGIAGEPFRRLARDTA